MKNSHSFQGADINTDHNLVVMKAKIRFKAISRPKKRQPKWDLENFTSNNVKLAMEIDKKLGATEGIEATVAQRWETMKAAILNSAEKEVGYIKHRVARKPWVSKEVVQKMEESGNFRIVMLQKQNVDD